MSEQNKALVRKVMKEVWQNGNIAVIDDYYSNEYVSHSSQPGIPEGREGVKVFTGILQNAFSNDSLTIEDQMAEGDKVVTRWSSSSKHTGEFMGVPATGNQVQVTGIDVSRIAGGKIVESWGEADMIGMMQQIGAIPVPE